MSNEDEALTLKDGLMEFEPSFESLNVGALNPLRFATECEFAFQALKKNATLLSYARANKSSLKSSIMNVAAIGISLNPAHSYAFLVPRKIKQKEMVCLDISYRGLIKLAVDTGRVMAMKAEIVYEKDTYKYRGWDQRPEFLANPFGDRGDMVGVYCLAILDDQTVMVENMTIDDVYGIRNDSEAYKYALSKGKDSWEYKNCVWVKYEGEMIKKTVIKRAYKTIPPTKKSEILNQAIDVLNTHEGIDFDDPVELAYTEPQRLEYERCVKEADWMNLFGLTRQMSPDAQMQLQSKYFPEPEKGKKLAFGKLFSDQFNEGGEQLGRMIVALMNAANNNDELAILELHEELSEPSWDYAIENIGGEAAQILTNTIHFHRETEAS